MWVVMNVQPFDFTSPLPIQVKVDTGRMIGYLPVFATLEDARAEFPGKDYMEAEVKEEKRG